MGAFAQGPLLLPVQICSIEEFAAVFGDVALTSPASVELHTWFAAGGQAAVIVRAGGPEPLTASELVSGIGLLATASTHWDLLCLGGLSQFDDVEFLVIARHAHRICDDLGRSVEIVDDRARLATSLR